MVLTYDATTNLVDTHFSTEQASVGALTNAGELLSSLSGIPVGWIDLRCTNTTGKYKTASSTTNVIENADIHRFSSGAGGGGDVSQENLRNVNIQGNPGFESGTSKWTASGGTFSTTTLAFVGNKSGTWDASAASQTLCGDQVTIPDGLQGQTCYARTFYKGGDANLKLTAYDGTTNVASKVLAVQSSWTEFGYPFQCPSSGTLSICLESTADAALVDIDQVFLGLMPDKGEVVNPIVKTITGTVGSVGSVGQISAGHVLGSSSFNFTPADDLAYWHLSSDATDNSGVTACSSGAAACDLTNNGSTPFTGTDLFGATGAATLNGTSQYFSSTDAFFNPGDSDFTVWGWFKSNDWSPSSTQTLMGQENSGSDRGWYVDNLIGTNDIRIINEPEGTVLQKTTGFVDGSWHFVLASFRASDDTWTLYLDLNKSQVSGPSGVHTVTSPSFEIGALRATPQNFFSGSVSNVGFVTKLLSDEDIRKLYSYKQPLNLTIGPESQEWLGLWSRSDGQVKNQLENGWLVDKRSDEVFWDLSSLDSSDSVDLKLKQLSFNANTLSSATYDSGVLSAAPTFPLAHGLPGRPLSVTVWVEGATTAGTFDPRTDLCSADATNLTCDLSSLTIDGTHRIEITASMIPGGSAIRCSDGTTQGLFCGQVSGSGTGGVINLNSNPDGVSGVDLGATSSIGDWVATEGGTGGATGLTVAGTSLAADIPLYPVKTSAVKLTLGTGASDYVRLRMTVPQGSKNRKLGLFFYQHPGSYTDGDIRVEVYKNSVSDFSGTYTEVALSSDDSSGNTTLKNADGLVGPIAFDWDNSDALEVRFVNNAATPTGTMTMNSVTVTPSPFTVSADVVGGDITFTPTISGISLTTSTATYNQVGSKGHFSITGEISSVSGTIQIITLPNNLTIDSSNLDNTHNTNVGTVWALDSGTAFHEGTVFYEPSSGRLQMTTEAGGGLWSAGNPFTWAAGDSISFDFTVPIAEWAGSTTNVGNGDVEYASNSSTTDSDDTSSFVHGPSGSSGILGTTALTGNRRKRVHFLTPIQVTDHLELQVYDGEKWLPISAASSAGLQPMTFQNGTCYGMGLDTNSPGSSDTDVFFCQYFYPNGTTYGAAGAGWDTLGSVIKWRVVKSSNPSAIGFANATGASAGLTKLPDSEIQMIGGSGHGLTNTNIRRFTTIQINTGTGITITQSATNGDSFTINEDGIYSITYSERRVSTGAASYGLSLNSSQLTTSIGSITAADRLAISLVNNSSLSDSDHNNDTVSVTARFSAGDIIRAHTSGLVDGSGDVQLRIVQVVRL